MATLYVWGWPEPYMYGVYTVFLAGKSPNIQSYTVYIYGSGQLYIWWIALSETYALLHKLRTGYGGIQNKVTLGNWRIWYWTHCHASPRISWHKREGTQVGLARTVYIHRIWLYIWWFPCQKYCIYTVYICFWPTLLTHWKRGAKDLEGRPGEHCGLDRADLCGAYYMSKHTWKYL